jgi:hypothetical protein
MNQLPNFSNAHIGLEKLTEYCLNEFHPYGKAKAVVFKSALGITSENADILKEAILNGLGTSNAIEKDADEYGRRYEVVVKIRNFAQEANVITSWIIKTGEDFPRLTSCYIKRKKK